MSKDSTPKADLLRAMREEQTAQLEKRPKLPAKGTGTEAPPPHPTPVIDKAAKAKKPRKVKK
jgi:hypothetical protein